MKKTAYITAMAAAALMASCSGTRNLAAPDLEIPQQTVAGMDVDSLSAADTEWWKFYSDSTLCYIIRETLEHNSDFLAAASRVEELRQLYGIDKLNYMPDINGTVGATRETNHYDGHKFSVDSEVSFKASLSWEIDLWGGLSAARRASGARYMASVYDRRAMQMTLISEAATAYFNLVALDNELNIVKRTLATRIEALEKAKLRFEGGLTSEIVYQQAKVEYATTASLVPGLEQKIELARNAITLLMGRFPGELTFTLPTVIDESLPRHIPVGLPSRLLERRPDVRATEQRLKAAMADCGVAYSNRFPRLRIGLTGGWENDQVAHLFESPFSYMLGNIAGTIFDFGKKRRKYKASIAAYEIASQAYSKAVMAAFTEVSNAAISYRAALTAAERRRELRDAAMKYVTLANKQYFGGTINYIDVLDAHRRYFDAQIGYSNAVRDEYLAMAALYKALGGGWDPEAVD